MEHLIEMRIHSLRKIDGSLIPTWLKKRSISEICQGTKLCYAELVRHGYSGQCFPRLEVLAKELGVTRRQIRRYLEKLKKLKLIEIEERAGHANYYYFLLHNWMIDDCASITSSIQPPSGQLSLDEVFWEGLNNNFKNPLIWHSWRYITKYDQRHATFYELKTQLKAKYEACLKKIHKGISLTIP